LPVFGINGGELIILLLVVALVVGPERLPGYAEQLGRWARGLRRYVQDARQRVDEELGDAGVDWESLDPRQYDPRRIVREALLDDTSGPPVARTVASRGPAMPPATPAPASSAAPAPYDDEAT
jgi:sec-independent protein translocase protein TatB